MSEEKKPYSATLQGDMMDRIIQLEADLAAARKEIERQKETISAWESKPDRDKAWRKEALDENSRLREALRRCHTCFELGITPGTELQGELAALLEEGK